MTGLADEILASLNVSRESCDRIAGFVELLLRWQNSTNLIAPSTIPDVWHRHVLDSLQVVPLLPQPFTSFADLGSGSGFPALPLAIATGAEAHLYESNGKKAAFLREALRLSGARGHVHLLRVEELSAATVPEVQVVTARALAPLDHLLHLAQPFLVKGATGIFHKGQDVDVELTNASKYWRIKASKHPSLTDSRAVILVVEKANHVSSPA